MSLEVPLSYLTFGVMWTLFPGYNTEWYVVMFHMIGRLTAPIMWFFIAEGYYYTHDVKKYAGRLFLLAAISHFAYNFCFGIPFVPFQTTAFNQTGVVWSLAWGLVLLYIHDRKPWKPWLKILITIVICFITFPSDWSCIATMAILAIGTNKIPLLRLYNGKRGSMKGIGKLFYIYYPLHLFICGIIRILLWGVGFSTGTSNF